MREEKNGKEKLEGKQGVGKRNEGEGMKGEEKRGGEGMNEK